jgi:putative ATPase
MASMTPAIVSRCRVFAFEPLTVEDVVTAMRRALADAERGYGRYRVECEDGALRYIARSRARRARGALGAELPFSPRRRHGRRAPRTLPLNNLAWRMERAKAHAQRRVSVYDMLSAFNKSMRGSDRMRAFCGSRGFCTLGSIPS